MELLTIGTSGWYYDHWSEVFYPPDLPPKERLRYYSQFFSTVEINSSFYHLPAVETIKNWMHQVGSSFVFSAKASQYITHRKRLIDPKESLSLFLERISGLKPKLGPILFQLPPKFKQDLSRLEEFLSCLSSGFDYVFEFRNDSWFTQETYDTLKRYKIALCISDLQGQLSPIELTAPFIYIRLHGPKKAAYRGSYSDASLVEWKQKILNWKKKKIKAFCYFDNDEKGYAVKDALRLKKLVEENS